MRASLAELRTGDVRNFTSIRRSLAERLLVFCQVILFRSHGIIAWATRVFERGLVQVRCFTAYLARFLLKLCSVLPRSWFAFVNLAFFQPSSGFIEIGVKLAEHRLLVQGSAWDHVALVVKRTQPRNGTPRSQQEYPAKRRCASGYCTCSEDALADGEDFALELIEATAAGVHAYPLEERLAKMARHHAYIAVRKRVGPDSTLAQLGVSTHKQII